MLSALIVYLSMFIGKILRSMAQDETREYKKKIIITENIALILTSLAFIFLTFDVLILLFIISFIFFRYFRYIKIVNSFYFFIGFGTFLSFFLPAKIIILSSLSILIILHSSLEPFKKKDFFISTILFALPFSLLLIENFINANLAIFTGLIIGGLLAQLKGP